MNKPKEIQHEHSKVLTDKSRDDNRVTTISLVLLIKVLTGKMKKK